MAISKIIYKSSAEATPEVWMDTTDKTADSGNMLNGTTALKNDGTTATGNIQSQAAQTIYPSTSDQTIASGKYLTGAQTIKGVLLTNLSAGNIKKDVVVKVGDSADDDRITSVTGTYEGSGGGSGLVYETGTYTPAADIDKPTISFSGTHTQTPCFVMVEDISDESTIVANSNTFFLYGDLYIIFNDGFPATTTTRRYGLVRVTYFTGSATSQSGTLFQYTVDSGDDTVNSSPRYYVSETSFSPNSMSTSRYWRTGRTYKWIAVWPPIT